MDLQQRDDDKTQRPDPFSVRVHYTNVHGLGAKQVITSLLPSLRKQVHVSVHYVPDDEKLQSELGRRDAEHFFVYKRRLPKAISRLFECLLGGSRFEGDGPLLVLGDLPLRVRGNQYVLVHSPHLVSPNTHSSLKEFATFWVSRQILKLNSKFVTAFFVQSEIVAEALKKTLGITSNEVVVIPSPPPNWVSAEQRIRIGRHSDQSDKLSLFYPAAEYPHKNHRVIWAAQNTPEWSRLVHEMIVTIPRKAREAHHATSVFSGTLMPDQVLEIYSKADALVFPSKNETVGLPLLEAMVLGLPIVVSDLPYARALCGTEAIYFHPDEPKALISALAELRNRLHDGWWPNWHTQVLLFPKSWDTVAENMLITMKAPSS